MIRPSHRDGAAFSEAVDGDMRNDRHARASLSRSLRISPDWATLRQAHGDHVVRVTEAGDAGVGDAIWTTQPGLPVAVFTADCFGVVLAADEAVGVAHAGWRGTAVGIVDALRRAMRDGGHVPHTAAIGPGIDRCCFEVGPEVAARFPEDRAATTWGTEAVDLSSALRRQLEGIDAWAHGGCTHHEHRWFSHRRDGTRRRLAALGWVP